MTSHLQAQLSALQYRAPHVIHPDNSEARQVLPHVGQTVINAGNAITDIGHPLFVNGGECAAWRITIHIFDRLCIQRCAVE